MNSQNDAEVQFETVERQMDPLLPQSPNRLRLWLVDDNGEFRSLLAQLLAHEDDFDCTGEFASPREMLAALAHEPAPDAILLDVQMGEECGLDAIQPVKLISPATRVIMLTTCFDSFHQTRARQNGAADFLLKSYSLERIASRVRCAMAASVPVDAPVAIVEKEFSAPLAADHRSLYDLIRHQFFRCKIRAHRIMQGAFFVRSWLNLF